MLGVRVAPRHSDSVRHVDLDFMLNVDRAAETSIVDCATGFAHDPEEAIRQAIAIWADTTASVALELNPARAIHCSPGFNELAQGRADEHGQSLPLARPPGRQRPGLADGSWVRVLVDLGLDREGRGGAAGNPVAVPQVGF